jgi:hypothetical protein
MICVFQESKATVDGKKVGLRPVALLKAILRVTQVIEF